MGPIERRWMGGGLAGGVGGAVIGLIGFALLTSNCASDDAGEPPTPETLLVVADARPGDLVGLRADDERRVVTWLHRVDGTIHELDIDDPESGPETVGEIDIGTDSQQGGLLDQAFHDGERILVWTTVADNELVVGDIDGTVRWSAGRAGDGAIGGKLLETAGGLVLGLGRNTAWDEESGVGGALLRFDGDLTVEPTPISVGYTNPWAFTEIDGELWVWDNAAGPDPDDPDRDDVERIGRADLIDDRDRMTRSDVPDRAPTAIIPVVDDRLAVCGFLDNELRAYEIVDGADGARTALDRAGTLMPCNTGATVFDDGTIVTAAQTAEGESLQILRP